jgi:hypothetical protein
MKFLCTVIFTEIFECFWNILFAVINGSNVYVRLLAFEFR